MLRTLRYYYPFFSTEHQNVSKLKSRAAGTVNGPIFLPLYVVIVSLFLFFVKMQTKQDQTVIIGYNLSKKHNLALHETQIEEPNYVDHKFFFNILLGPTCAKTWAQISKYYRTG